MIAINYRRPWNSFILSPEKLGRELGGELGRELGGEDLILLSLNEF